MSDTETVYACPECNEPTPSRRSRSGLGAESRCVPGWLCDDCGARFDEPVTRAARESPLGGHAKLRRAGFEHLVDGGDDDE